MEDAWVMAVSRNSVTAEYTDGHGRCTVGPAHARAVVHAEREDDLAIHGFDAGIYRVLANADGCQAVVQQFELREGANRTLRILLLAR